MIGAIFCGATLIGWALIVVAFITAPRKSSRADTGGIRLPAGAMGPQGHVRIARNRVWVSDDDGITWREVEQ